MRKLKPHSKSFLKACKKRKIEVSIEVFKDATIITSVCDNDVPHYYRNENDECVYHTVCKKILGEVLNTNFSGIDETEIRKYLSSKDWLEGMEIIYNKISTLKNIAFKEWHKEQITDLEKLKKQYYQENENHKGANNG